METITKKSHPKEWAIIIKALPNYRKRSAFLHANQTSVTLHGRYWDGGSRTTWHIIRGNLVEQVPSRNDYPFTSPETEIDLRNPNDGVSVMVVSSGTFCGKPSTASLYMDN